MKLDIQIREPDLDSLSPRFLRVFAYWDSCRGDRFAPSWGEFRLDELSPSVIPYVALVEVRPRPLDFVYRFFGAARCKIEGRDPTGESVRRRTPAPLGDKIFKELAAVVERRAPIHVINVGVDDDGREIKYEFLRLPLSSDRKIVDKIVSIGFQEEDIIDFRTRLWAAKEMKKVKKTKKKTKAKKKK